eukprot:CAMPEP_0115021616 /NCGR_PEP_ID=MMETSP0216-20121206/31005_1 /TAXON_ID=223996 /ORGANISM="Protocruzia adherens, Strain Boccale" /LENGTH=283 /DNA_ID=CAMNT_0002394031 /DNA_START=36 /DNA_END=887 /DNA_ORIENTATION=+
MVLETVNNTRKNRMHGAIKRNDIAAVVTYIETEAFPVNEEISVAGYHWTSLHYAAHFGTADILAYLIEKLYIDFDNIRKNVNVQTREGWTPLMIGSIYGQLECVKLLVKSGAADLFMKDIKGKTARDLALLYKKMDVHEFLQHTERGLSGEGSVSNNYGTSSSTSSKDNSSGASKSNAQPKRDENSNSHLKASKAVTRTVSNIGKLEEGSKALDEGSLDDNRELLTKGFRLPCLLCLENKGLLQYLVCCGHPIHPLCWPMNMRNICPSCRHSGYIIGGRLKGP